ncbi:MAG: polyprenyl synthetase family protein [FCB group bacterium]|nr:polyprenyl synthetase family protein [FCB group bacterium]
MKLSQIIEPVKEDLKGFNREFDRALHSDVALINTIGKFLIKTKGKHIRPVISLLASRLCGEPTDNTYRAAAMIELLHLATLVHDDVVDEAKLRRGWPSTNRIWKNKTSVLMGDYILSKSLIYMIQLRNFDALEAIAATAEMLSAGEILQIEKSLKRSITEEIYFKMVTRKTASLIATSAELGAITTTGNAADRQHMYDYGLNLGIAFQVKDDLFDILGSEADTGKDMGADVKRNMMTLPVIFALDNADISDRRQIRRLLKSAKTSARALSELKDRLASAGGISHAEKKIHEYSEQAISALTDYPDSIYKQSLIQLLEFNAQRKK